MVLKSYLKSFVSIKGLSADCRDCRGATRRAEQSVPNGALALGGSEQQSDSDSHVTKLHDERTVTAIDSA